MVNQTWIFGKAIRHLFADRVTYNAVDIQCGQWRTELHSLLESLLFNCGCKLESCKTEILVDAVKILHNNSTKDLQKKFEIFLINCKKFI